MVWFRSHLVPSQTLIAELDASSVYEILESSIHQAHKMSLRDKSSQTYFTDTDVFAIGDTTLPYPTLPYGKHRTNLGDIVKKV